ncbi:hypothetical protein ACGFIF_33885 [Kribbella sp. NPDC049174]|uniref:hypothetical protein n=1 Tax=Kribbella sp. NPDC049174 TaxID=3364112 RepID=UPI00371A7C69
MSEQVLAAEMKEWSSSQFRLWITTLTEASAPTEINWWLRVRIMPQSRVYNRTLPADVRREWAMVFLLLVEGSERFADLDRWEAATDAANMRALLINELGPLPGDETWDPAALVRSVLATTTLHPQAASEMARRWRALPREETLLLRRHKNLLAPLTMVIDQAPAGSDRDIARAWLAVRASLP